MAARLEIETLGLSRRRQPLVEGLSLSLAGGRTAIVGAPRDAMEALALELAGLGDGRVERTGKLMLDGAPYPTTEAELARLRRRIGLLRAGDGMAGLAALNERAPVLLICDDPMHGLVGADHRDLSQAILDAQAARGFGLLLLTGDMRLALAMAATIIVFEGSRPIESGTTETIERSRHGRTRELLGAFRPGARTAMRPQVGEPLLEFDAVERRIGGSGPPLLRRPPGKVVVTPTTLAVGRGEAVGLLGGAGSGKSVLLRLAAGLGRCSGGALRFDGDAYHGDDLPAERRSAIAMVFSDPHRAFNPALPVGLSLTEPLRVEQQLLVDEQADQLVEVVRAVGIDPSVLGRRPAGFGAMDLQRLALARALASRPRLLLLDEPTWRLDAAERSEFLVLVNRVRADNALTVLSASRDIEVLGALCDRIVVLERGRIIEEGTPAELSEVAQQAETRRLVAPRYPRLPGSVPPPAAMPVAAPEPQPEAAPVPPAAAAVPLPAETREPEAAAGPPVAAQASGSTEGLPASEVEQVDAAVTVEPVSTPAPADAAEPDFGPPPAAAEAEAPPAADHSPEPQAVAEPAPPPVPQVPDAAVPVAIPEAAPGSPIPEVAATEPAPTDDPRPEPAILAPLGRLLPPAPLLIALPPHKLEGPAPSGPPPGTESADDGADEGREGGQGEGPVDRTGD